ncbi:MAG: hypothetical protein AAB859_01525 [Patescibacteria group bacterium]
MGIHDQLDKLSCIDELILMEADTLGGLDTDFVKPSFTKEENQRYMKSVEKNRRPLFITDYAKNKYVELFEKRSLYYTYPEIQMLP